MGCSRIDPVLDKEDGTSDVDIEKGRHGNEGKKEVMQAFWMEEGLCDDSCRDGGRLTTIGPSSWKSR